MGTRGTRVKNLEGQTGRKQEKRRKFKFISTGFWIYLCD